MAADPGYTRFDEVTVYYSVFSSTSLQPDIAQQYGLVRGKDQVLINIAVVKNDESGRGIPARVSGSARNLMQQQKTLEFKTIAEQNATYYLASLRVLNEEVFHFEITVSPEEREPEIDTSPYVIKFTKKLYHNE